MEVKDISREEFNDNITTEVIKSEEETNVEVEDISPEEFNNNVTVEVIESGEETGVEVEDISTEKFNGNTTTEEVPKSGTVEITKTVTSETNATCDGERVGSTTTDSVQHRRKFFSAFHEYCVEGTGSLTIDECVSRIQQDKDSALNWSTDEVNNHREELLSALPDMSSILGGERRHVPPQMSPYEVYGAYMYLLTFFLQQYPPSILITTPTDTSSWIPSPAFANVSDPVFPCFNPFNTPVMMNPVSCFNPSVPLPITSMPVPITTDLTYPCSPSTPVTLIPPSYYPMLFTPVLLPGGLGEPSVRRW